MRLQLLATLAANWLLPLLLVAGVAAQRVGSRMEALPLTVIAGAYIAYVWRASPLWPWLGNHWPAVFVALYVAAVGVLAARLRNVSWLAPGANPVTATLVLLALSTMVIAETVYFARARWVTQAGIELAFPLRGGLFQIVQGGNIRLLNHHVAQPAQRFALDIVALNANGRRAESLKPADVARYAIFGMPVYAPCTGKVIDARDGQDDDLATHSEPATAAGNYTTMHCGTYTILLAHLMKGSLAVTYGAQVTEGAMVGRVGSSGNSTEPHLHIHAVAGRVADHVSLLTTAVAVPMHFQHKFLVRNDLVEL